MVLRGGRLRAFLQQLILCLEKLDLPPEHLVANPQAASRKDVKPRIPHHLGPNTTGRLVAGSPTCTVPPSCSTFWIGLLTMFLARLAYCSVLRVSSTEADVGEQHAMSSASDPPPRLSISSLVSMESRYGTCTPGEDRAVASADITWRHGTANHRAGRAGQGKQAVRLARHRPSDRCPKRRIPHLPKGKQRAVDVGCLLLHVPAALRVLQALATRQVNERHLPGRASAARLRAAWGKGRGRGGTAPRASSGSLQGSKGTRVPVRGITQIACSYVAHPHLSAVRDVASVGAGAWLLRVYREYRVAAAALHVELVRANRSVVQACASASTAKRKRCCPSAASNGRMRRQAEVREPVGGERGGSQDGMPSAVEERRRGGGDALGRGALRPGNRITCGHDFDDILQRQALRKPKPGHMEALRDRQRRRDHLYQANPSGTNRPDGIRQSDTRPQS